LQTYIKITTKEKSCAKLLAKRLCIRPKERKQAILLLSMAKMIMTAALYEENAPVVIKEVLGQRFRVKTLPKKHT